MPLRRRLTIAFVLAVGVSAVALAAGSYFVVRHNLLADSVKSALKQTRRNLELAPSYLPNTQALLKAYDRTGGFDTVGVERGQPFSKCCSLGLKQVPAGLRRLVKQGQLGYQRETVAGKRYVVVGGPAEGAELYFFFSEQGLRHELSVLRNILLAGGGLLVLLAALAGAVLARQTLRPVARASAQRARSRRACWKRGCLSKDRTSSGPGRGRSTRWRLPSRRRSRRSPLRRPASAASPPTWPTSSALR